MSPSSLVELLPEVRALPGRLASAFVDGAYVHSQGGQALDAFDPATEALIASALEADDALVDRAVRSAQAAFEDGRWSGLRPADRERILLKFAAVVEARAEELAQLESWNQGKSINLARAVDVGASVEFMRYFAGLATKITGHTMDVSIAVPPGARYAAQTRREPIGVVAGVAPWNFPLMISLWKVVPALAAGCSIVLKPSEITPLTTFRLAELALEAGVPPGVFNVVHGRGATTGAALTRHPAVRKITFTGSTAAGKTIARTAADTLARVSLELGGKNPAIVLADADLSKVVPGLLAGGFMNGGQVCAAVSRVYVERAIHDRLAAALADAVGGMSLGAGLDPAAQVNPLVSAVHRDKVLGHVEAARASGVELVHGGATPDAGYYVSPTLALGAGHEHPLNRHEVFGPVLSLIAVDDAAEALKLANDTAYGLAASLWTDSLSKALALTPRIEAGTLWVNSHAPLDPHMPFGGFKQSGWGRDFGPNALDAYLETKSVCMAY
jgi:phenylacetaldehyde dehydrogenase